ncbi:MAG: hypothetical protein QM747_21750 [Nocardioides sp.]
MNDDNPGSAKPPEPTTRRRADVVARSEAVWRARVAGATWSEAAEIGGYANGENAARAVRQTFGVLPEADRAQLRALWRERLEVLWKQVHRDALDRQSGAVTSAVRVAQAAAKLDGLDAPTEILMHEPTQHELSAWVARVVTRETVELMEADICDADSGTD